MASFKAGCRINTATVIELRLGTGWTGLAKEKIVRPAPNVRDAEMVSAWEDAGKKTLKECSKCIHCNKCVASGNDEDWESISNSRAIMQQ